MKEVTLRANSTGLNISKQGRKFKVLIGLYDTGAGTEPYPDTLRRWYRSVALRFLAIHSVRDSGILVLRVCDPFRPRLLACGLQCARVSAGHIGSILEKASIIWEGAKRIFWLPGRYSWLIIYRSLAHKHSPSKDSKKILRKGVKDWPGEVKSLVLPGVFIGFRVH